MLKQTDKRNLQAVAAWERKAGPMEKRGKGRTKEDNKPRSQVKFSLKRGDYDG